MRLSLHSSVYSLISSVVFCKYKLSILHSKCSESSPHGGTGLSSQHVNMRPYLKQTNIADGEMTHWVKVLAALA